MCIYRKKNLKLHHPISKVKKIQKFVKIVENKKSHKTNEDYKKNDSIHKKTKRKRKHVLFQILLSPYYSHSLFLLLKACPLLSLILYHSFSFSLSLSLSLSPHREQLSFKLPSERNSMLHKTHKQRKERPTSPLSDTN